METILANDIQALVDELWQSPDLHGRARAASAALTAGDRTLLGRILEALEARAAARRLLRPKNENAESALTTVLVAQEKCFEGLLVLLTLAAHHSDSLLYLPPHLREARLESWADSTGLDIGVVREASTLGPFGLRPLLRAA